MSILHNFLSFYFQTLLLNIMAHIALINSFPLKVSKRKAYILAFICANFVPIADALSIVYVGGGIIPYTFKTYWILKFSNIIGQLILILFIGGVFNIKWYKCYWWAIIVQNLLIVPVTCTYILKFIYTANGTNLFHPIDSESLPEYLLYLFITFFVGCVLAYIGRYIGKIKKLHKISTWYWYSIYSLWAVTVFISDKSYGDGDDSILSRMSNINQLVIFFILLLIILFISTNRYDKKLLKMEIDLLKQQNEIQYENYLTMQQQEIEIHKLYHDIGNHIETIKILLNDGDSQEAREYTNELTKKYKDTRKYYSNNKIINAVLSQKFRQCEQNSIIFDYELRIPENLLVKDIDLMSVFSNLLDNAIECCQRNSNHNNYIDIKAMPIGNYFTVKVINSKPLKDEPDGDKNYYRTSKKDKSLHGYGLKIIEEIVQRYDGKAEFKNNIDSFSAMVMLKMEL